MRVFDSESTEWIEARWIEAPTISGIQCLRVHRFRIWISDTSLYYSPVLGKALVESDYSTLIDIRQINLFIHIYIVQWLVTSFFLSSPVSYKYVQTLACIIL
jgi:hypothetical protein